MNKYLYTYKFNIMLYSTLDLTSRKSEMDYHAHTFMHALFIFPISKCSVSSFHTHSHSHNGRDTLPVLRLKEMKQHDCWLLFISSLLNPVKFKIPLFTYKVLKNQPHLILKNSYYHIKEHFTLILLTYLWFLAYLR